MNIPDEVLRKAWADFYASLGSGGVAEADFLSGFRVGAEWAQREALKPVFAYLNHCRILRQEPTTAGLSNALAETDKQA